LGVTKLYLIASKEKSLSSRENQGKKHKLKKNPKQTKSRKKIGKRATTAGDIYIHILPALGDPASAGGLD